MNCLRIFSSHQEALLAAGYLQSHGLQASVRGAKEYSAHITGIDTGRYELLVPASEKEFANELLVKIENSTEAIEDKLCLTVIDSASNELRSDSNTNHPSLGKQKNLSRIGIYHGYFLLLLSLVVLPVVPSLLSIYVAIICIRRPGTAGVSLAAIVLIILNLIHLGMRI